MSKNKIATGLIIAVVMLFSVIPVWAGGSQTNLRGADINIGVFWDDLDPFVRQPLTEYEERFLAHQRRIQTEHNFRIRQKNVGNWENMLQRAVLSTMAGNPDAQIYLMEGGWARVMLSRGLLFPISDSRAVDMTPNPPGSGKVEWSAPVRDAFTRNGKTYAWGTGHGRFTYQMLVFFNKRLFREAGIDPDLPYNMQRDGTWTWDNFLELCKQLTRDTNNDGTIDVHAMAMGSDLEIHNAIISSNGANYIEVDSNGRFINTTTTPAFAEALHFARRLRDEGVLRPIPEPYTTWDWYLPEFMEGRVAMHVEPEWRSQQFQTMRDDWGVVVFPRGPRVNDYVGFTDELVYIIPNTYTLAQVDQFLRGYELWATPMDTDPNAWKDYHIPRYRDSRAVDETLAILQNPRIIRNKYHLWVPNLNVGDIVWSNWITEMSVSQLIESVQPAWNAIIAEANDM